MGRTGGSSFVITNLGETPTWANDDAGCGRGCVYLDGIGRLADNATPEAAQGEMTGIAAALEKASGNENANVTETVNAAERSSVKTT